MILKILGTACAVLLFIFLWVLVRIDPASSPLTPTTAPEAFDKTHTMRPLVVMLSYADGHPVFFKNQNALDVSAINRGIDAIHTYRRHHMEATFYQQHKGILEQKRGAGYWLWKPYFILKTMAMYPEGALILYADSGVILTQPLTKILEELKTHDRVFVGQGKPVPLRRHLKKEAQIALDIDHNETILSAQNLWAFFMAFRNTAENRAFVKKWLDLCTQQNLLTDAPFEKDKQESDFEFHQHDQSLLSVVAAQHPEKTTIIKKNELRNLFGVTNFHRHPEEESTSPLLLITGMPEWLSNVLFNNPLMRALRRLFL